MKSTYSVALSLAPLHPLLRSVYALAWKCPVVAGRCGRTPAPSHDPLSSRQRLQDTFSTLSRHSSTGGDLFLPFARRRRREVASTREPSPSCPCFFCILLPVFFLGVIFREHYCPLGVLLSQAFC